MHITGDSHSVSPSWADPAHQPFLRKAIRTCAASRTPFKSWPSLEERMLVGTGRAVAPGAMNCPGKAAPEGKGAGNKPGQTQEATEASTREPW